MKVGGGLPALLRSTLHLALNPTSLVGVALTTGAGLTMVGFWALEVLQFRAVHPYAGIILFLGLPGLFALGLLLIPLGIVIKRRKLLAQGVLPSAYPKLDFHDPALRHATAFVAGATLLNVAILSTASYKGVAHMDSVEFCGQTCHTVMTPEYTAYVNSPHSRVSCVECHIGAGADWFVRSKLSGTRQVFAVALGTYSRPIPSPVEHLRPARETCEQCHWPQKFHGDKFLVRTKFAEDEQNTRLTTVLVLKIGGRTFQGLTGIHGRHLDDIERISYQASDDRRQVIPRVTYLDDSGTTVEYVSSAAEGMPAQSQTRQMDCVDCHNRPTHAFELPERALDRLMAEGSISRELPFIKKKAVELLKAEYNDRDGAAARIASGLMRFYEERYPDVYREQRALVEEAASQVKGVYERNVFPEMRVSWGTHPNNIGHEDFPGCFRCHDDDHKSSDGRTITQECEACHQILALEEPSPAVLAELGLR